MPTWTTQRGIRIDVSDEGQFVAEYNGDTYEADSLARLKGDLDTAVRSSRLEIPFVAENGRRGVLRGFHASRREILVTYEDGTKAAVPQYTQVWAPEDVTEAVIEEIRTLNGEINAARARLKELTGTTTTAENLLNNTLNENITDSYLWEREQKAKAEGE
jgi:hypothetical protein